jgi:hypothetical protein
MVSGSASIASSSPVAKARTDRKKLLLLLGRIGLLEAQVPQLADDEVELAEGNLLAVLHLLRFVAG